MVKAMTDSEMCFRIGDTTQDWRLLVHQRNLQGICVMKLDDDKALTGGKKTKSALTKERNLTSCGSEPE
jgi:hypothetical protein